MTEFNMKQWLQENKAGAYSKMNEVDPAALGAAQDAADAEFDAEGDGDTDDDESIDEVEETVGYVMKTKPSDPNRREPLEM